MEVPLRSYDLFHSPQMLGHEPGVEVREKYIVTSRAACRNPLCSGTLVLWWAVLGLPVRQAKWLSVYAGFWYAC